MIYFVLILIFACANDFFYLLPGYHIKGVFNINDIGNLLIWVSILYYLANTSRHKLLLNNVSLLIVLYLFLVLIHVSIATVNYNQSIISGLIKSRHQFYYLSYFLFLMALDTDEKAERFMKYLSSLGIFVLFLSMVNYSGLTIFHEHKWAEGHGERGGITRAFIPAMSLIAMMYIWYMTKVIHDNQLLNKNGMGMFLFSFGLLFRQTRGRTIAALGATVWALMRTGRIKVAVAIMIIVGILGTTLSIVSNENILFSTFTTAYSNIKEGEGSWRGRSVTLQHSIDVFMENPIIGSGALLLRKADSPAAAGMMYQADAYQADLGWAHWLKNFGLAGVCWYLVLAYILWGYIRKLRKVDGDSRVSRFGEFQFVHITISMVTINYLVKADGILVFCLALALITRPALQAANNKRGQALKSVSTVMK